MCVCLIQVIRLHVLMRIFVIVQESLLDADHHVAVALGPADKPGSSVRTHNIYMTYSFSQDSWLKGNAKSIRYIDLASTCDGHLSIFS